MKVSRDGGNPEIATNLTRHSRRRYTCC